jgi:hypothetical protein
MRSRCMSLLPRTTLHSDSEQLAPRKLRNLELSSGQILTGGNGEDIYKHPVGENWATEVSRLGA